MDDPKTKQLVVVAVLVLVAFLAGLFTGIALPVDSETVATSSTSTVGDVTSVPPTTADQASEPPTTVAEPESQTDQEVGETDPVSGLDIVALSDLPPEATDTYELIRAGGPYLHDRDGLTFENREGILPARDRGWYAEFTVETPGSSDRGARRIVTGAEGEVYYTSDHYQSFSAVEVNQ